MLNLVVHEVTDKPKDSEENFFNMDVLYYTHEKETYITTFNLTFLKQTRQPHSCVVWRWYKEFWRWYNHHIRKTYSSYGIAEGAVRFEKWVVFQSLF